MTPPSFNLEQLYQHEFFSNLDYAFAVSIAKIFNEDNPIVKTSLALASRFLALGHICVDIKECAGTQFEMCEINEMCERDERDGGADVQAIQFPEKQTWISALENSSLVSDDIHTPLVLDAGHRLYISRYFDFQQRLIANIIARLKSNSGSIDINLVDQISNTYFPEKSGEPKKPKKPDNPEHFIPQQLAIKHAVSNSFTIISGGPGTGKTFIIKLIRQVLSEYAEKKGLPEPRILCLAPTGKAASKMEYGRTIHSALKPLNQGKKFYHNKSNPLHYDLVIIDEASMIDLPLFVRLLEAIPEKSGVILTGDAHQLSAIQAGAVFSDLCKTKILVPHRFELEYNFRSHGKSGIEKLSQAIKDGNSESVEALLLSDNYPDIQFIELSKADSLKDILTQIIPGGYNSLIKAENIEQALENIDSFRILCAHYKGYYGTQQINPLCEKILQSLKNFDIQSKSFKPVMIRSNDYKRDLFNGDTGILSEQNTEQSTGQNNESMAFFKKADDKIKTFRYSDLPAHESAFAITVHKSQGSEFDTVLIIIPDKFSPVVTRELLYTGVTRARKKVILVSNRAIIKNAIAFNVKRYSGIGD